MMEMLAQPIVAMPCAIAAAALKDLSELC